VWVNRSRTGGDDDSAPGCLVLAHEMDSELGAVYNTLIVDICCQKIWLWGNPDYISAKYRTVEL
jgi:hypothetical protein